MMKQFNFDTLRIIFQNATMVFGITFVIVLNESSKTVAIGETLTGWNHILITTIGFMMVLSAIGGIICVWLGFKNSKKKYWKEEMEKCKKSPYYYYTTYWQVNGKPATTRLSEEEFNEKFKLLS